MDNKGDNDNLPNKEVGPDDSTVTSIQTYDGYPNLREKIRVVIHSQKCHIAVISLVLFDVVLVIIELLLDMSASQKKDNEWLLEVELILKCISITILCAFTVEILIKLYVMQMEFFHHYLEVFDAAVIITSLVLDIVFMDDHSTSNGLGFIIIFRLWRIVRVISGIIMTVKAQADTELEEEKKKSEKVLEKLKHCQQLCKAQQEQLTALRNVLEHHGIEAPILHLSTDTDGKGE